MDDLTMFEKCIRYPYCALRIVIVILMNIYCLPTYVIWMTTLWPLKYVNPDWFFYIEGIFFDWLCSVVATWPWSAGYEIFEFGDDIRDCLKNKDSRTLILVNHQSTADVPLMMTTFSSKPGVLPNIMWIMDRVFKYTNFGIVSLIHEDFFIAAGKDKKDESLKQLREHLTASFIPRNRNFMVLFPEGGFLRKRRYVSQLYAQKHNLPVLQNVTLPRFGAINTIFDVLQPKPAPETVTETSNENTKLDNNNLLSKELVSSTNTETQQNNENKNEMESNGRISWVNQRESPDTDNTENIDSVTETAESNYIDYVLDITIAYENGKPLDLWNIVHGYRLPCRTYFIYRLYRTEDIPQDQEKLNNWLYARWEEKEALLENFYANKGFTLPNVKPQLVEHDILRFVVINLFFLASTYFHFQLISSLCKILYLIPCVSASIF